MKPTKKQPYSSVRDLATILSYMSDSQKESIGVNEIAKGVQMTPNKVSGMLRSLEKDGFFKKESSTGKYMIGERFLELGQFYLHNSALRRIIHPHLEQITAELKLTSSFAIFRRSRIVVVEKVRVLGHEISNDLNLPIHSSSHGKIFLSSLSDDEAVKILKKMDLRKITIATVTDIKQLIKYLRQVRKVGYSLDIDETRQGLTSIAVPVKDLNSNLVASLNVLSYPVSPFDQKSLGEMADYLKSKAFFISKQLGYTGRR